MSVHAALEILGISAVAKVLPGSLCCVAGWLGWAVDLEAGSLHICDFSLGCVNE